MEPTQKLSSRKKFLLWSAAIISSATFLKFLSTKKSSETDTVKMLTQDGKLVEINKNLLASTGNKISNKELQQFIKK